MINVTKSYLPPFKDYVNYLEKIYESGWLTNNGSLVQRLTKELQDYLGVKNLLLVANATLGLQIAYKLLDLKGEVITTPFSFVATTSSLIWQDLKPKFVDIHPDTFFINEDLIEHAITEKTSALLPVHVYGNTGNLEQIDAIAKKHNLKVIYDAAHAFDVQYKNKNILSYGDISVLSFHATKLFHTVEGGALIISDDELYEKAIEIINFGFDHKNSGQIKSLGINAKMSELHAAMGLCILKDMNRIIAERKRVDTFYRKNLPSEIKFLVRHESISPNYAYFPVIFENEIQLLNVLQILNEENIYPRRYFNPSLNELSFIENKIEMPISQDLAKRVLCLPLYAELNELDVKRICEIICKAMHS